MASTPVVIGVALFGALAQVVVTILFYQPPPGPKRPQYPVLEAGLFGVTFLLVYLAIGFGLRALEGLWPPFTGYLLIGVSLFGMFVAGSIVAGRMGSDAGPAVRGMSLVTTVMVWLYPLVILLL